MTKEKTNAATKADDLDKMQKRLSSYYQKSNNASAYGGKIGKTISKRFSMVGKGSSKTEGLDTNSASSALASLLFQTYKGETASGCGDLLMEWTIGKFWGKTVLDKVDALEKIWQYLHDNKRTKNNSFCFGDMDGDIWVEYPKQLEKWEDKRKIIVHKSHCTCANDNTHIFIFEKDGFMGTKIDVRTVWPRQISKGGYKVAKSKEYPDGWFSWGDDRDIKVPSIRTYRDRNWKFSYGDARDKGYVLSLESYTEPKIDWAHIHQSDIQYALSLIKYMTDMVNDPESYECT